VVQWTANLERHTDSATRKRLAEWVDERDAAKARLLELGEAVEVDPETDDETEAA